MAASMALQVLVSPLLGTVFDNLSSLIQSEFALLSGVTGELGKLSSTLSTITDVIEDAEMKQFRDKPIQNWLRKLKDVAYDAEDILDDIATEALTTKTMEPQSSNNVQVLSVSSRFSFKQVLFRRSIAKRIREVQGKFNEIAKERLNFHLAAGNTKPRLSQQRETSSFEVEEKVYGRDDDKEYMVKLLINNIGVGVEDGDRQVRDASVCVIHGMGGLGKTTLAKMVYNDGRIVDHFQLRCWVCVSDNFDPKSLLKATIESLGGVANDLENLDPLQRRLQEKLSGKRFLVVLDDVWNDDQTKWDLLKSSFRCGSKGSSIVVTTRLQSVVLIMSTLPVCRPKGLSEEDCWSLFTHRAFDTSRNEVAKYSKLEVIGKEIVKRCGGIPLAAKALGGLLRFKREEKEWLCLRDNKIWELQSEKEDDILSILRLSYDHLPSHLRPCFAYCSIFPKDCKLERKELIHLWMANGFVPRKRGGMELEDVGNEMFNELLWRSFFQDIQKDKFGDVLSCKMHDLMHDLACSIMGEECLLTQFQTTHNIGERSLRHLSFVSLDSRSPPSNLELFPLKPQPNWRTLLFKYPQFSTTSIQLNFKNLKNLRALDLSRSNVSKLLDSIGNLKHLRYLDISFTGIKVLPNDPFCQLRNLQTLKLNGCNRLEMLPQDLSKLSKLRHLYIEGCDALTRMPNGMGKLVCLQTLSIFSVGPGSGSCIEQLERLNNLSGTIVIKGMENVRTASDAKKANLMGKKNLNNLELVWSSVTRVEESNDTSEEQEEVLFEIMGGGLKHHLNMKKVGIKGYGGATFPGCMSDLSCLLNVVKISLIDCQRCRYLPSLGQLPLLKVLKIKQMDSVKYIRDEFYHGNHGGHDLGFVFFPSLEDLTLSGMPNLEEWLSPSSSEDNGITEVVQCSSFPCLRSLTISKCPKLRRCLPLPVSLRRLQLTECRQSILIRWMGSHLPCLSNLYIVGFDDLISFPVTEMTVKTLQNLTYLRISHCSKLKILPQELMENLTSLIKLVIKECPELEFSPNDFQNLTSLRALYLINLPKMTSLPLVGSDHVGAMLEALSITDCSGLTTLPEWITNLSTLIWLEIWRCKNFKFLPEGLERLKALSSMEIIECHPDLHRRCNIDKGTDWHKISHIRYFSNIP